ncbi:MAG: KEOPS complex subunit Cgi121 [Thermoplasmata archaeon]|jgi:tRNA threonylcarbamoyladenosine modification (KEOPS) complex Cgi121 subunit
MLKIRYFYGIPTQDIFDDIKENRVLIVKDNGIMFEEELISAYLKAKRSVERNKMRGKTLESEFLIYISGDTQIDRVLKEYGISNEKSNYFIIYLNDNEKDYGMEEKKKEFSDDIEKLKEKLEKIAITELKK